MNDHTVHLMWIILVSGKQQYFELPFKKKILLNEYISLWAFNITHSNKQKKCPLFMNKTHQIYYGMWQFDRKINKKKVVLFIFFVCSLVWAFYMLWFPDIHFHHNFKMIQLCTVNQITLSCSFFCWNSQQIGEHNTFNAFEV